MKNLSCLKSGRGMVAVELALTLPVLLLFAVVIVDLGLLLREHQIVSNAAREGARFSSLPKNRIGPTNPTASAAAIKQYVVQYCADNNLSISASEVNLNQNIDMSVSGGRVQASEVTVQASRQVLFLGGFGGPTNVTLRARSTFVNLY